MTSTVIDIFETKCYSEQDSVEFLNYVRSEYPDNRIVFDTVIDPWAEFSDGSDIQAVVYSELENFSSV